MSFPASRIEHKYSVGDLDPIELKICSRIVRWRVDYRNRLIILHPNITESYSESDAINYINALSEADQMQIRFKESSEFTVVALMPIKYRNITLKDVEQHVQLQQVPLIGLFLEDDEGFRKIDLWFLVDCGPEDQFKFCDNVFDLSFYHICMNHNFLSQIIIKLNLIVKAGLPIRAKKASYGLPFEGFFNLRRNFRLLSYWRIFKRFASNCPHETKYIQKHMHNFDGGNTNNLFLEASVFREYSNIIPMRDSSRFNKLQYVMELNNNIDSVLAKYKALIKKIPYVNNRLDFIEYLRINLVRFLNSVEPVLSDNYRPLSSEFYGPSSMNRVYIAKFEPERKYQTLNLFVKQDSVVKGSLKTEDLGQMNIKLVLISKEKLIKENRNIIDELAALLDTNDAEIVIPIVDLRTEHEDHIMTSCDQLDLTFCFCFDVIPTWFFLKSSENLSKTCSADLDYVFHQEFQSIYLDRSTRKLEEIEKSIVDKIAKVLHQSPNESLTSNIGNILRLFTVMKMFKAVKYNSLKHQVELFDNETILPKFFEKEWGYGHVCSNRFIEIFKSNVNNPSLRIVFIEHYKDCFRMNRLQKNYFAIFKEPDISERLHKRKAIEDAIYGSKQEGNDFTVFFCEKILWANIISTLNFYFKSLDAHLDGVTIIFSLATSEIRLRKKTPNGINNLEIWHDLEGGLASNSSNQIQKPVSAPYVQHAYFKLLSENIVCNERTYKIIAKMIKSLNSVAFAPNDPFSVNLRKYYDRDNNIHRPDARLDNYCMSLFSTLTQNYQTINADMIVTLQISYHKLETIPTNFPSTVTIFDNMISLKEVGHSLGAIELSSAIPGRIASTPTGK
tara:strand:+ start:229 stop:2754 length:2526 start_codon:yes stop_codon:yes gene_type:complete